MAFCTLGAAEIWAIYRERRRQNREFANDRELSQARFEQTMERFEQVNQLSNAHGRVLVSLMENINDPAESLKNRALHLSESILNLLSDRIQLAPVVKRMSGGLLGVVGCFRTTDNFQETVEFQNSLEQLMRYHAETVVIFGTRFSARVNEIKEELAHSGLSDVTLDSVYLHPANIQQIQVIGEHIGTLADKVIVKQSIATR